MLAFRSRDSLAQALRSPISNRSGIGQRLVPIRLGVFFLISCTVLSHAQVLHTQEVSLQAGWNAVYLEVSPEASDPATLFADTPIDVVASYVPSTRGAQFVENPAANLSSAFGWSVWYAPQRGESFLTSLYAIYGGKPYLVHATSNVNWSVEGQIVTEPVRWLPLRYVSLTGMATSFVCNVFLTRSD
jgi:hypothetical protein